MNINANTPKFHDDAEADVALREMLVTLLEIWRAERAAANDEVVEGV